MGSNEQTGQAVIMPFAMLLTVFLWLETWVEILSRGAHRSPDDLSKLYLAVMAAYSGAAEISKWLLKAPTDPTLDPRFEKIQRGGVFIGLWMIPLLFAYTWRISNSQVPMPGPLNKIVIGLVGIFFLKAASRRLRHERHGVIDSSTGDVKGWNAGETDAQDSGFSDEVYRHVAAASDGASMAELTVAFPDSSRPRLYRALDRLMQAKRLTRTGKPRTPDVRYRAVSG